MEIAYWIVGGLVALVFLFAGVFKLITPKDKLVEKGMNWTTLYSANGVRGIAAVELLGALGLILPPLTGIAPWLAPVAAFGLVVVMLGAMRAHRKLDEPIVANIALAVLALAAAVLGFIAWV